MCGIIGIVGKSQAAPRLIESLKRLEYRGYDSAGVAAQVNGVLERRPGAGQAEAPRRPAGGPAARRRNRHRPHALGHPRRPHRAQRPPPHRRPRGGGAQRHHRELRRAEGRAAGQGPGVLQRHRHRGGGPPDRPEPGRGPGAAGGVQRGGEAALGRLRPVRADRRRDRDHLRHAQRPAPGARLWRRRDVRRLRRPGGGGPSPTACSIWRTATTPWSTTAARASSTPRTRR